MLPVMGVFASMTFDNHTGSPKSFAGPESRVILTNQKIQSNIDQHVLWIGTGILYDANRRKRLSILGLSARIRDSSIRDRLRFIFHLRDFPQSSSVRQLARLLRIAARESGVSGGFGQCYKGVFVWRSPPFHRWPSEINATSHQGQGSILAENIAQIGRLSTKNSAGYQGWCTTENQILLSVRVHADSSLDRLQSGNIFLIGKTGFKDPVGRGLHDPPSDFGLARLPPPRGQGQGRTKASVNTMVVETPEMVVLETVLCGDDPKESLREEQPEWTWCGGRTRKAPLLRMWISRCKMENSRKGRRRIDGLIWAISKVQDMVIKTRINEDLALALFGNFSFLGDDEHVPYEDSSPITETKEEAAPMSLFLKPGIYRSKHPSVHLPADPFLTLLLRSLSANHWCLLSHRFLVWLLNLPVSALLVNSHAADIGAGGPIDYLFYALSLRNWVGALDFDFPGSRGSVVVVKFLTSKILMLLCHCSSSDQTLSEGERVRSQRKGVRSPPMVVGTPGYLAPEVSFYTGSSPRGQESTVYGMVVLENSLWETIQKSWRRTAWWTWCCGVVLGRRHNCRPWIPALQDGKFEEEPGEDDDLIVGLGVFCIRIGFFSTKDEELGRFS
nr:probable L-type lectin-domain containing receptor kinase S.5 [Ipomoea batatas]